MKLEQITAPSGDAFEIGNVLSHARMLPDQGDYQHAMTPLAEAAVAEIEAYASIAFLTRTIRVSWPCWPKWSGGRIPLPIAPLTDAAAVGVIVGGQPFEEIEVITGRRPAVFPTVRPPPGELVITYDAGFGDDAASVPADLALAVADQALFMFDHGGQELKGTGFSPAAARIAARYRRVAL